MNGFGKLRHSWSEVDAARARRVLPPRPSFKPQVAGSLSDHLRGLVQANHEDRNEDGAGGDQGEELGHVKL